MIIRNHFLDRFLTLLDLDVNTKNFAVKKPPTSLLRPVNSSVLEGIVVVVVVFQSTKRSLRVGRKRYLGLLNKQRPILRLSEKKD